MIASRLDWKTPSYRPMPATAPWFLWKYSAGASPRSCADDVLGHQLALAHGVLGVGDAEAADSAAGEVGNRAHVAGAPGIRHHAVVVDHAQVGADAQASALVDAAGRCCAAPGWP